MTKKTGIIILNYNNATDTINCISSVTKYNTAPIKIVVVDNGSTNPNEIDVISTYLRATFSDTFCMQKEGQVLKNLSLITLLVCARNGGYSKGNNAGLNLLFSDDEIEYVLILNSDILFVSDIIPSLIDSLENLSNAGIVSPLLYKKNMNGIDYECARKDVRPIEILWKFAFRRFDLFNLRNRLGQKRYILKDVDRFQDFDSIEIELPSGSCMLIRKDLSQKIEGFDTNTFLYFEENILFKKINSLGLINYLIPSQSCIHLGATTISKSSSVFINRCDVDSSLYYLKTYQKISPIMLGLIGFFGKMLIITKHIRSLNFLKVR